MSVMITKDGAQFLVTTDGVDNLIKTADRVEFQRTNGSQDQYRTWRDGKEDVVLVVMHRSEAGELLHIASRKQGR